MSVPINYCERFHYDLKKVINSITEEEAKARSLKRELYTALLIDPNGGVHTVIQVASETVNVSFLDEFSRRTLTYTFSERKPARIFLEQARTFEYDDGSDEIARASHYIFKEGGQVFLTDADIVNDQYESSETTADPSLNWEDFPTFGNYEAVARRER